MKKVLFAVFGIVVVVVVVFGLKARGKNNHGTSVEIAPVVTKKVVETVDATGKIQPKTQVNISADVSAKITRLMVKDGDWVEKGTLLLELDRERYLAAVESAEANLSAAKANVNLARENMDKAEIDLGRAEQLFQKHLESQASLDSTKSNYEVEKARYQASLDSVSQAKAALKQANDDLAKTTIYAPLSGTVSQLNKEEGEIALGSQFQEDVIMVLSDLKGMEALVDVDENDIVSLAIGDNAEIEVDALPGQVFKGAVTEIANTAKISGTGTTDQKTEFEVKVDVTDPSTKLRPGMTASAEIVTEVREDVVAVPIQCVSVRTLDQLGAAPVEDGQEAKFTPDRDGFVDIVWVVENGHAQARQVKTGIQGETDIAILDGLAVGENVVVGSYRAISRDLSDGAPVLVGGPKEEGQRP